MEAGSFLRLSGNVVLMETQAPHGAADPTDMEFTRIECEDDYAAKLIFDTINERFRRLKFQIANAREILEDEDLPDEEKIELALEVIREGSTA